MNIRSLATIVLLALAVGACGVRATTSAPTDGAADAATGAADPARDAQELVVYKNPSCGCCRGWIQHMQGAGFRVHVENVTDLTSVKQQAGVPANLASCHTAHLGKYFVEGHVPAEDVRRLLAEQPAGRGLVAPGMPLGSPGMPGPAASYDVLLVRLDGSTTIFQHHGG